MYNNISVHTYTVALYITGFAKTNRTVPTTEIQFNAYHCSYTQPLSRHTSYKAVDGQVYFHRWPFFDHVKPRQSTYYGVRGATEGQVWVCGATTTYDKFRFQGYIYIYITF